MEVLDAETLPIPERQDPEGDLRELATAQGVDAVAARWEAERAALLASAAVRAVTPIAATAAALRVAPPAIAPSDASDGRAFGALVHRMLEWLPLDRPEAASDMAQELAPSFGLDGAAAARAAREVEQSLALPVMERARRSPRVFRELPVWLTEETELIEGVVDLVFEEDGSLVVVDYKTDQVPEERLLDQAAHHAPQLRLYGRALALATGQGVRERIVLFTAIPRAVPV